MHAHGVLVSAYDTSRPEEISLKVIDVETLGHLPEVDWQALCEVEHRLQDLLSMAARPPVEIDA